MFAVDEIEVEEWLTEAVEATHRVTSLRDLSRSQRLIFFQKCCGVLLLLEQEHGDLAFVTDQREMIVRAFGVYTGAVLHGPPWRMSPAPSEDGRPTKKEWVQAILDSASFDEDDATSEEEALDPVPTD